MSNSFATPARLLWPRDFPGKNTGVGFYFSRESSWPRDQTHISSWAGGFFTTEPPGVVYIFTSLFISKPIIAYWRQSLDPSWPCAAQLRNKTERFKSPSFSQSIWRIPSVYDIRFWYVQNCRVELKSDALWIYCFCITILRFSHLQTPFIQRHIELQLLWTRGVLVCTGDLQSYTQTWKLSAGLGFAWQTKWCEIVSDV